MADIGFRDTSPKFSGKTFLCSETKNITQLCTLSQSPSGLNPIKHYVSKRKCIQSAGPAYRDIPTNILDILLDKHYFALVEWMPPCVDNILAWQCLRFDYSSTSSGGINSKSTAQRESAARAIAFCHHRSSSWARRTFSTRPPFSPHRAPHNFGQGTFPQDFQRRTPPQTATSRRPRRKVTERT